MSLAGHPVSISETIVPEDIRTVILSRATLVRARAGQHVVAVGLPSNDVFLILKGRVSVSLMSAQGRETLIRTIGRNQIFGELSALDGVARSADVIAAEPLRLAESFPARPSSSWPRPMPPSAYGSPATSPGRSASSPTGSTSFPTSPSAAAAMRALAACDRAGDFRRQRDNPKPADPVGARLQDQLQPGNGHPRDGPPDPGRTGPQIGPSNQNPFSLHRLGMKVRDLSASG